MQPRHPIENTAYPDRHRLPAELAAELRAARRGRGLGLRQVAREIGASPGYLTLLEQGKRCPSIAFARELAATLDLDPSLTLRLFDAARPDVGRSGVQRAATRGADLAPPPADAA